MTELIQDIRIPINDFVTEIGDATRCTHLATISVFELTGPRGEVLQMAYMKMADEDGDWMEVPPHMAAQLPMAMNMMKQTKNG